MTGIIEEGRLFVLIIALIYLTIAWYIPKQAMKGKKIDVRSIPAFDAMYNAVGRSVELGRPILFSQGGGVTGRPERSAATLAGYNVLSYIAGLACDFGIPLIVPVGSHEGFVIADAIVTSKYLEKGADLNEVDVRYIASQQFVFSNALTGVMEREKPGACFLIGTWGAEALNVAEASGNIGAITIGGEGGHVFQIPSLVASCDYILIGEELYGAQAMITKDEEDLGGLLSNTYMKIIMILLILLGSIISTFGSDIVKTILSM